MIKQPQIIMPTQQVSETAAANLAENGTSASEGIVLTGPKTKHRKQFDQIDAEFRERIDRIDEEPTKSSKIFELLRSL